MEEKMISVIIPVYNAEKYIEECLDSIVNQTIGTEHIEIILVDDGSTDGTLKHLMEYEQKFPNSVLVVPLKENSGQANARNIGIFYAKAPYLTFVDADDWLELNAYEKMLEQANHYQCDMVQCGVTVHAKGGAHDMDMEPGYFEIKNEKERNEFFDNYKSIRMIGNTLYRTEWIKEHGFEFKNFAKYEDNYWSGIIFFFLGSCCAISNHFYHYRIWEFSNSQIRNDERHFERLLVELEKLKFYQENGLFDVYYEKIRGQFLQVFYANTLHIIFCKFDYIPLERIMDMQSIVREIFPDYLDYCKESGVFVNQVLTAAFNFPLDVWEDYKEAYLGWVERSERGKLALFYAKMRKALGLDWGVNERREKEDTIDYFLSHKENLGRLSVAEGREVLQIASAEVYGKAGELKNKGMELLYNCCFYLKNIGLKELWNIYWILNSTLFMDGNAKIGNNLDELYRFIFLKVRDSVTDKYERIEQTNSNLVILTTDQFLGLDHAPTRRIMDYAYTIATTMQKEVIIVNDTGMHYGSVDWLWGDLRPRYVDCYENVSIMCYKGMRFSYMQICAEMPDIESIKKMLHRIYLLQPELVYNIGGSNLLSDLCSLFTKTACFPCSTDIPITMSEYLLVGRGLNENDDKRLERLESYQKVIETVVNYNFAAGDLEYKRASFGVLEDDFLIGIIGNRLDIEMSEEFIRIMDKIITQQNVHFLIIGEIQDAKRIKIGVSRIENLHFAGKLDQAAQAIKLCDVYCNPRRNGGGRSSFESIAQGVPVITLKFGDVYYTCGDEFAVDTYDDFLERVKRYMIDQEFLEASREKAVQRAGVLSDLPGTQRKILEQIL